MKNTVYPTAAYLDSMPALVAPSHAARVGDEGGYTQWSGFGLQYPNPSRSKIELPMVSSRTLRTRYCFGNPVFFRIDPKF
jgi:hypothetical protein